jgi:hypothetical protein
LIFREDLNLHGPRALESFKVQSAFPRVLQNIRAEFRKHGHNARAIKLGHVTQDGMPTRQAKTNAKIHITANQKPGAMGPMLIHSLHDLIHVDASI